MSKEKRAWQEKLLDASLVVALGSATLYFAGFSYLDGFHSGLGIPPRSTSMAPHDVMSWGVIFIALPACVAIAIGWLLYMGPTLWERILGNYGHVPYDITWMSEQARLPTSQGLAAILWLLASSLYAAREGAQNAATLLNECRLVKVTQDCGSDDRVVMLDGCFVMQTQSAIWLRKTSNAGDASVQFIPLASVLLADFSSPALGEATVDAPAHDAPVPTSAPGARVDAPAPDSVSCVPDRSDGESNSEKEHPEEATEEGE